MKRTRWAAALLAAGMGLCALSPVSALAVERYLVMKQGDRDEYVLALQQELKELGYLSATPTGYYGTATVAAVKALQEDKNITVDGIAGIATQKALYGSDYAPLSEARKALFEDAGEAEESVQTENASAGSSSASSEFDSMEHGSAGTVVREVQRRLQELGYFPASTELTEYFGDITEDAVRAFQKANGLEVDGVVGPLTFASLFSSSAIASVNGPSQETIQDAAEEVNDDNDYAEIYGTSSGNAIIEKAISCAISLLGVPYVYGGRGPSSFDCSGFTTYVLEEVGIDRVGNSAAQGNNDEWEKIAYEDLQRGDLLIFTDTAGREIGHVGIYLGEGRFIHASSGSAKSVTISTLSGSYLERFLWGRRWIGTIDPAYAWQLESLPEGFEPAEGLLIIEAD